MLALLILPSFLVCFLGCIIWCRKTARKLPPSPPSLPILGHLHLLGNLPHQSLYRLSQIYGPLMHLRLGSVATLVASSPDMAKEILQNQDLTFASRPRTAAGIYTVYNCSDIAWSPYGPYWRQIRQICVMDLLNSRRMEDFKPIRVEEKILLVRSIWEDSISGHEIPVLSKLMTYSNNVISKMALGKPFSQLATVCKDPSVNIVKLFNELLHLNGQFVVGDFLPYLQWMDLQGYVRKMKRVAREFDGALQEIVDDRREARKKTDQSDVRPDFLDLLLQLASQDSQITDNCIKALLADMFSAATDTSAMTTEWALAELLRDPKIMRKLQAEMDSVIGRERLMQESDIHQLPYLQAVVKETMRLHPTGPLLIPHESTKPCTVGGFEIPEKTRALVNVWAIGRDADAWEKPLRFWPERFMGSNVDVKGKHFQLLPFGAGRRGCPGLNLGLVNVQIGVGSLVHAFEWQPYSPTSQLTVKSQNDDGNVIDMDMSEQFGLTVGKAVPLLAIATPRLLPHVYQHH